MLHSSSGGLSDFETCSLSQLVRNKQKGVTMQKIKQDKQFKRKIFLSKSVKILSMAFRYVTLIAIAFVILSPMISVIAESFYTSNDVYNPMVYLFPMEGTLGNYELAIMRTEYWKTLVKTLLFVVSLTLIQIMVCSTVGYGFARFNFPFKKILFACVIITIVIPSYTIMLPLYMQFRNFDPLSLFSLFGGEAQNWLRTMKPVYLMTILGCGLRSGLFIYIFIQFFRGIPKEIEEAAFVDGAGAFRTFLTIMLPNAQPAIITVAVFSLVWQYNDSFLPALFGVNTDYMLGQKISSLTSTIQFIDKVMNPEVQAVYLKAGVVLMIIPILIIYILLQRRFIEGVERSGIVG